MLSYRIRWIECHINYLLSLSGSLSRREALVALPQTLEQTYTSIIEKALDTTVEEDTAISSAILKYALILVSVDEPRMKVSEICQAVSFLVWSEEDTKMKDIGEMTIARLCGKLIRRQDTDHWVIGHDTVTEYLQAIDPNGYLAQFRVTSDEARETLAQACARFVTLPFFARARSEPISPFAAERDGYNDRIQSHPFYRYAATYWPLIHDTTWSRIGASVNQLFQDQSLFKPWFFEYCLATFPDRFNFDKLPTGTVDLLSALDKGLLAPLHVSSAFAIPELCGILVAGGAEIHAPSPFGTPLQLALQGPDRFSLGPNDESSACLPPTDSEIQRQRRSRTIELLLGGEACDEPWPYFWKRENLAGCALRVCMSLENPSLFCAIVEAGAEPTNDFIITFKDLEYSDYVPFPAAWPVACRYLSEARRDYLDAVLTFLTERAFLKIASRQGWMHLDPGVLEMLEECWGRGKLLDLPFTSEQTKRRVDCTDDQYRRIFSKAIRSAFPLLLERLIQDPRSRLDDCLVGDEDGQCPLHIAVENKKGRIMEILLHTGANPSVRDDHGRTPLLIAETMNEAKMLLEHGADITERDNDGRSLWHYASANNDWEFIVSLIEYL